MLISELKAGPYSVRGVSLGGVYTSLHVPELDVMCDVGAPLRSAAGVGTLLLSHAHADHVGALVSFLGLRALHNTKRPLRVIMPAEIEDTLVGALAAMAQLQRWPLAIEPIGLRAGDTYELRRDVSVRAVQTFHPVPSLGYLLVQRVPKLRAAYTGLPGPEIARRRQAGEEMFDTIERREFAYVTDTLISAVEHAPELLDARVLVIESTFLDERKSRATARAGCHIHLDEIIERAAGFVTPHLVLMHVSQLYQPREVGPILDARLPPDLRVRTQALLPARWPE